MHNKFRVKQYLKSFKYLQKVPQSCAICESCAQSHTICEMVPRNLRKFRTIHRNLRKSSAQFYESCAQSRTICEKVPHNLRKLRTIRFAICERVPHNSAKVPHNPTATHQNLQKFLTILRILKEKNLHNLEFKFCTIVHNLRKFQSYTIYEKVMQAYSSMQSAKKLCTVLVLHNLKGKNLHKFRTIIHITQSAKKFCTVLHNLQSKSSTQSHTIGTLLAKQYAYLNTSSTLV